MINLLGKESFDAYENEINKPFRRALRVNTLKTNAIELSRIFPDIIPSSGISSECLFVPEDFHVSDNPYHIAGLFYMQEPSAQYPVILLNPRPGETVLDLCAAPGGKSSQIAGFMQNRGLLISNEINPSRAAILNGNMERMGVRNAVITNMSPETLCPLFPEFFDAILVDAPCSGEGMFRREPNAISEWSPEAVKSCAIRQYAILNSAGKCVRQGGRIVYSTCTFSKEENEDIIDHFLSENPDYSLIEAKRFYPHTSEGEGQFAALMIRTGHSTVKTSDSADLCSRKEKQTIHSYLPEIISSDKDFNPYLLKDGRCFLLPDSLPSAFRKLHVIRAGVLAGTVLKSRFEPAHCLFMAYPGERFLNSISVDEDLFQIYMGGNTVPCDPSMKGYLAVQFHSHPIGFGKAVSGTVKNHIPKGLRLRN